MDRCPAGHERTRKKDGSLGLFCTDCGYRFPSTDELQSFAVNSASCEIDALIGQAIAGFSFYEPQTNSFYLSGYSSSNENVPSISKLEQAPRGCSGFDSSADSLPELIKKEKEGVEEPKHYQLGHEARSEPPAPLDDSTAHKGARPKGTYLGAQKTDSVENGQKKLENSCQSEPLHTNVAVENIPDHSQQRVSLSRAASASPVLSLGNHNNINNSSFESIGISSIGDKNSINNCALDSSGVIRIGRGNIIHDSRVKSDTSIVIGDGNIMKDSQFMRKQKSAKKDP